VIGPWSWPGVTYGVPVRDPAAAPEPERCEVCDGALDEEPWERGRDGAAAHRRCIDIINEQEAP
jgi:hypothetical protein